LLLGSTFLFLNIAIQEIPALTSAVLRTLIAAPICYVLMRAFGARMPTTRQGWISLFWLGLLTGAIPFGTISWGQQHIASGMGGILFGTMPILSVVLAPVFLAEETFTKRRLVGALIGFAGVIAVIGRGVLGDVEAHLIADLAVLAAAVSIASANVLARKSGHLAPIVLAVGAQSTAVLVLVPMSAVIDQPWNLHVSWETVAALVFLGTVGSALPGLVFYKILARVGATRASLVAYLVPVVAVVLGAVFLAERLPWEALAGMALIVLGAWLVNQRKRKDTTTRWLEP